MEVTPPRRNKVTKLSHTEGIESLVFKAKIRKDIKVNNKIIGGQEKA